MTFRGINLQFAHGGNVRALEMYPLCLNLARKRLGGSEDPLLLATELIQKLESRSLT